MEFNDEKHTHVFRAFLFLGKKSFASMSEKEKFYERLENRVFRSEIRLWNTLK